MLVPFTVDVPMERVPWANWALIAVTSVVSLAILVTPPQLPPHRELTQEQEQKIDKVFSNPKSTEAEKQRVLDEMMAYQGDDYFDPYPPLALIKQRFSPLQLFTHLFVHGGLLHLIGNMLFLFCFGNAVNAKLGHAAFLAAYFLLGAFAGLAWLMVGGGEALVGASGAIMGIVGVFLVFFPKNDVCFFYWYWAYTGSFNVSGLVVVLFYMGCDLYGTIRAGDGVAYVAHLGGELAGIGLGLALAASRWVRSGRGEENLLQMLGLQRHKSRDRHRPRHHFER